VLIAVVVLSLGLLGLAALQAATLTLAKSSFHRTQAVNLAYDITDQMRVNRDSALDYVGDYSSVACDTGFSRSGSGAAADIAEWRNALACRLPSGSGSIAVENPGGDATRFEATVQVFWSEARVTDEEVAKQLRPRGEDDYTLREIIFATEL
jgi:type IV pilus assembly protein PilV